MNDKIKEQSKGGREPDEKTIFVCSDVRCGVCTLKLGYATAGRGLASTVIPWNIYGSADDRLANQKSQERLVVIP